MDALVLWFILGLVLGLGATTNNLPTSRLSLDGSQSTDQDAFNLVWELKGRCITFWGVWSTGLWVGLMSWKLIRMFELAAYPLTNLDSF